VLKKIKIVCIKATRWHLVHIPYISIALLCVAQIQGNFKSEKNTSLHGNHYILIFKHFNIAIVIKLQDIQYKLRAMEVLDTEDSIGT